MRAQILLSWLGYADLRGLDSPDEPGPLMRILEADEYQFLYLLHSQSPSEIDHFLSNIKDRYDLKLVSKQADITSPIHFGDIYKTFDALIEQASSDNPDGKLVIQLTSGTPAMTAVSILVGKAKYPARFIQASREQGVQEADLPFDIATDFLPALAKHNDENLTQVMAGLAPDTAAFDDILTQNDFMLSLKQRAAVLAQRSVPVLIYGETGTGKELFARAIRNSSSRADKPFLTLNCGAIPDELIDSTLFGHVKGAFTGASAASKGYFEQADGGTLFLDEFGELPMESQVRLLRVLQDGRFTPVGSTKEQKVDVRIIVATNKDLVEEIAVGKFREDLFYRVAIGVISLPPLRERGSDLGLLAEKILDQINVEAANEPGYVHKKISVKAKKLIQSCSWPGNVRELHATLLRASLWHASEQLSDKDIQDALLLSKGSNDQILGRDILQGIDINNIISDVCTHYIERALHECGGSKSKAADLLGLKNYQTLNNWMEKYGIK